ncbi:MAG: PQQ-binding-like beta-propeller repeat protein [Spirochaetes bacterium]|nr:PQQ-binding-like beta-propeller repeat protein [Spirochaetota bacterium]
MATEKRTILSKRHIPILAAVIAAVLGTVTLVWWFSVEPVGISLAYRIPLSNEMNIKKSVQALSETVTIAGVFKKFGGTSSPITASWPRFRGADFDNIAKEDIRLKNSWGPKGPPVLWSVDLGEGYAAPAVMNGRVYVLDYNETERADALRCFSLDNGAEIWRRTYKIDVKRNHGMSRTTPAVTAKYALTVGPKCHVLCVDAVSGGFLWGIDLPREQGTKVPLWYTGQCPLIDNNIAVIAAGGKDLLIGVDCASGKVVWRAPNVNKWDMSHASVMPMTLSGKRVYVYPALGGIVGVSAESADRGRIVFSTREWNPSVSAPSAVQTGPDTFLITAGYGAGSAMFRVNGNAVSLIYKKTKEEFGCEQQTPIFYQNHLFTVMPPDGGGHRGELVCMTPDGRTVYASGREDRFGLGPYMIADGKLFLLDDSGVLTMSRAGTVKYERLARAKLLSGRDSWGPLALVSGRMLLRDLKRLICIDLRE